VYYTAGQTEDGTADPYARENPDSADGSYQNAAGQNIQATGYFTEVENPAQKREE
jgi:hypothetical protein